MIPDFDDRGYLPPGVHRATLEEVAERFGQGSELRRTQMESVRWMVDLARRAGIERVILNGSFVTDVLDPNDVDCVLLATENSTQMKSTSGDELVSGLPFLEIEVVGQEWFDFLSGTFFATDRRNVPKGLIEVIL